MPPRSRPRILCARGGKHTQPLIRDLSPILICRPPRRYVEKFYSMRSQLQKISLRLQTHRTNEQMMQAMKGATMALGSMNKSMNLPALQRIAMEFERENDIMEQRQEMMDDAIDDAMDTGIEEEGDEIVEQVMEELGVDLNQAVSHASRISVWRPSRSNVCYSLARHLRDYSLTRSPKAESHKLSGEVVAQTRAMMICRPAWTVSGSDEICSLEKAFYVALGSRLVIWPPCTHGTKLAFTTKAYRLLVCRSSGCCFWCLLCYYSLGLSEYELPRRHSFFIRAPSSESPLLLVRPTAPDSSSPSDHGDYASRSHSACPCRPQTPSTYVASLAP